MSANKRRLLTKEPAFHMNMNEQNIQQARDFFPRGLTQPPGSFRFSIDALLLGSFLQLDKQVISDPLTLLDIGTGCGVVALAMLRRFPNLMVTGVELQLSLVQAARENALKLGFAERFSVRHLDISTAAPPVSAQNVESAGGEKSPAPVSALCSRRFDLALANPPYRKKLQGRLPKGESRQIALAGEDATLSDFCRAAAAALKVKGRFGLIFPASRLAELILVLDKTGFSLQRLLPVHSRRDKPALLVLAEAHKGISPAFRLEAPLVLYEGNGPETHLTAEALAFCQDLAVNPRRRRLLP
jgi:tRNA1(Val) A37 N6-methylase TrmN6